MGAEILRKAAALMRGRAQAATPGPWEHAFRQHVVKDVGRHTCGTAAGGHYGAHEPGCGLEQIAEAAEPDAAHIAGMHPAVALAAADLLDMAADHAAGRGDPCSSCVDKAIEVARAYLGEETP